MSYKMKSFWKNEVFDLVFRRNSCVNSCKINVYQSSVLRKRVCPIVTVKRESWSKRARRHFGKIRSFETIKRTREVHGVTGTPCSASILTRWLKKHTISSNNSRPIKTVKTARIQSENYRFFFLNFKILLIKLEQNSHLVYVHTLQIGLKTKKWLDQLKAHMTTNKL